MLFRAHVDFVIAGSVEFLVDFNALAIVHTTVISCFISSMFLPVNYSIGDDMYANILLCQTIFYANEIFNRIIFHVQDMYSTAITSGCS